jgi:hypothetical protein
MASSLVLAVITTHSSDWFCWLLVGISLLASTTVVLAARTHMSTQNTLHWASQHNQLVLMQHPAQQKGSNSPGTFMSQ